MERTEVELGGRRVPYGVRVSRRARTLQIQVDVENGIEVVMPARGPRGDPVALLRENATWVVAQFERLEARRAESLPADFSDTGVTPLLGHPCPLRVVRRPSGAPRAVYNGGLVHVAAAHDADEAAIREATIRLFRKIALEIFESRSRYWCGQLGVVRGRVSVRAQKTLWGSCSSEGNLSFNWRLVLGPLEALDYVVLHEVAHRVYFDHGPGFQALLDRVHPGWREWEQWLDERGDTLRI